MRLVVTQVFLCSLAFIKRRLEIQKVKSTANASKKIKTNHREAFLHNPSTFKSSLAHVCLQRKNAEKNVPVIETPF